MPNMAQTKMNSSAAIPIATQVPNTYSNQISGVISSAISLRAGRGLGRISKACDEVLQDLLKLWWVQYACKGTPILTNVIPTSTTARMSVVLGS